MERRLPQMLAALRVDGYRVTPQRLAILRILARSEEHPDVRSIHRTARRSFPSVSLATVYKTVEALKKVGQVMELEFSGNPNRFDGRCPVPHPHLICEACSRVVDSTSLDLAPIVATLGRESGFTIRSSRVDFFGFCPECQSRGAAGSPAGAGSAA